MHAALTDAQRQHLRQLQRQRRDDDGYVKVTVLLLFDKGRTPASVAEDLGLDQATVYRYAAAFAALGWEQETFHVTFSRSGLTELLHRLGFPYKLTTPVPCEANAAAQQAFLTELATLEAQVEAGQAVLYYADAAHPTHNTRCTRAWCPVGAARPLLTVSGRERVNLNAAVNAYQPTQVLLDEANRVDAQSTRRLYQQLLATHPTAGTLYVVCDNARYYKNKGLTAWLHGKPIVQVFLPPYSPNLNLIERLWKYLRQKIINTCFYRTKGQFRQAVLHFFTQLAEHDLTSLLTRKYHILDSQLIS